MRPWAMKALMNLSIGFTFFWKLVLGSYFELKGAPMWYPVYEDRIFILGLLIAAVTFAVRMEQEDHEMCTYEHGKIIGLNNDLVVLEVRRTNRRPKIVAIARQEFPVWDYPHLELGNLVFRDHSSLRSKPIRSLDSGEQGRIMFVDDLHVYVQPWAAPSPELAEVPLNLFTPRQQMYLFPGKHIRVQMDGSHIAH